MKFLVHAVVLLAAAAAHATVNDPFEETLFVSDTELDQITGIDWAPDGSNRLFITRKNGVVRVVQNGTLVPTAFAAVFPIYTGSECGLIGMAFDPAFTTNHYVYFTVCVSGTEQQIIRYTDNSSVGGDKTVIVDKLPTVGANHDGGGIGFGPDGDLYWSIGDQGSGIGVNADLTSLASKVGRVRVRGVSTFPAAAPNDNPFFDGAGPNNDYIWARGFRNPFTLTFQPSTGKLWLNVVGTSYEQIFVVGRGDHGGWNSLENNQTAPFIQPVVAYATNSSDTHNLASAARLNGVTTFTTSGNHRVRRGGKIQVSGVNKASFNGVFYAASVPSATTFTVAQALSDDTGNNGQVVTAAFGGCVTGGAFYSGTQFPPEYRGNFFFGDYNAGGIQRVTLDGADNVTSVDVLSTGLGQPIDVASGPDGFLYYAGYFRTVYRLRHKGTDQNLVVSTQDLRVVENGDAVVMVRLNASPAAPTAVTVTRSGGDAGLTVAAGAALSFTAGDWSVPQAVRIAAADDSNSQSEQAQFEVSASGLGTYTVRARTIDDDTPMVLVSTTQVSLVEGQSATVTVQLSDAPPGDVTVTISVSGSTDVSASATTLTFTPQNWMTPQTVTLAAADDADASDDTAMVTLMASGEFGARTLAVSVADDDDAAPTITTQPPTSGVLDSPYRYDVDAMGRPAPSFSLDAAPAGMTIDAASGVIAWTPAATGSFAVTVRAQNGIAPDATQSWTITVGADAPPTCRFTQPADGAVVSGRGQEWFGDGFDDVRTIKMELFVDGELVYTDQAADGHYHFGGTHNLWDTTVLADGTHRLRGVVTDTAGQTAACELTVQVANVASPNPTAKSRCGCSSDGGMSATPLVWVLAAWVGLRRRARKRDRARD